MQQQQQTKGRIKMTNSTTAKRQTATTSIQFRISPKKKAFIAKQAKKKGISLSALILSKFIEKKK